MTCTKTLLHDINQSPCKWGVGGVVVERLTLFLSDEIRGGFDDNEFIVIPLVWHRFELTVVL